MTVLRRPAAPGLRRLPARRRRADGLRRPARARGRRTSSARSATASSAARASTRWCAAARVLDAIERSAESGAWEPARDWERRGARGQRAAQLRRLRDDRRDRLPGARPRARARGDRRRRLRGHRPRPARLPRRGRDARASAWTRTASSSSAASCRSRFSERDRWDEGLDGLHHTLDLFDAAGAAGARPVLCDAGGPERIANPGRGGEDASLRLDDARWRTLVEGVARAADAARERGYDPSSTTTRRPTSRASPEIERFLEDSDVALLLDSGHIAVAGGDAVTALRDWGDRIGAIHVKDVRLDVLAGVKAERADTLTAWRRGLFCALGEGDVDLDGFFAALGGARLRRLGRRRAGPRARGRRRVRRRRAEQDRNRDWLREHAGW